MQSEIEKYKKYLNKARLDQLVETQRKYNATHADERVEAVQTVRTQSDRTRRILQNRGLASRPGNIISGEEPRALKPLQTQLTGYNDTLRQIESQNLEHAAAVMANQEIARRNAAAQEAARAEQERQENLQASLIAKQKEEERRQEEYKRKLEERNASIAAARQKAFTGKYETPFAQYAQQKYKPIQPIESKPAAAPGTKEQKIASMAANIQNHSEALQKKQAASTAWIESGRRVPLGTFAQQKRDTEQQTLEETIVRAKLAPENTVLRDVAKEVYYQAAGYTALEKGARALQSEIDAKAAAVDQLEQDMKNTKVRAESTNLSEARAADRWGGSENPQLGTSDAAGADYQVARAKWLQAKIELDELKKKQETARDGMQKINQSWRFEEALIRFDHLSDEELQKEYAKVEDAIQARRNREIGAEIERNALVEAGQGTTNKQRNTRGGKGSRKSALEKSELAATSDNELKEKASQLEMVREYRKLQQNAETVEAGLALVGKTKSEATLAMHPEGYDVPESAEELFRVLRKMGKNYNANSEEETGSKYYKAVNDRNELALYSRIAESNGQSIRYRSVFPTKDEYNTYRFFEYALQMTEEEVNAFNALYNTQGADAADKFFEALLPTLDARGAEAISEDAKRFAEDAGLLADIASVPINVFLGIAGPTSGLSDTIHGYETSKTTAYKNDFAGLIRENRQKNEDSVGSFFHGTLLSMADSGAAAILSKVIPGLGGLALGGSAYNSAYREAVDRGLSPEKAKQTAFATGLMEMIFEELSLEMLIKNVEAGKWSGVALQSITEGSEELNTYIADELADIVINGDKSQLLSRYRDLIDRGYSESQATMQVIREAGGEAMIDTLGGMVSGAGMTAGGIELKRTTHKLYQNYVNNRSDMAKVGRRMRQQPAVEDLVRNWNFQTSEAAKLQKQGAYTDGTFGYLYSVMVAEQEAGAIGKTVREAGGEEVLRVFKYEDAEAAELAQQETLEDMDLTQLYTAMQQQLYDDARQRLGVDGKELLPYFEKIHYGEQITHEEAERIAENKTGLETFNKHFKTDATDSRDIKRIADEIAESNRDRLGSPINAETVNVLQRARNAKYAARAAQDAASEDRSVTSRMTKEQKRLAALPSEKDKKGTIETERGSVSYEFQKENIRHLTSRQAAAVSFAEAVANVSGANIRIVDTMEANGMYDRESNTLTVALDSTRGVMHTVSHELTHWLEENHPEAYREFVRMLEEEINKIKTDNLEGLPEDLQTWIKENNHGEPLFDTLVAYEKSKDASLSDEGARSEAVAECAEPFLSNTRVQERLAAESMPTAKKIRKFLRDVKESIRALLNGEERSSKEAQILARGMANIERIEDAWTKAITEASKKTTKTGEKNIEAGILQQHRDEIKNAQEIEPASRTESQDLDMLDERNLSRFYKEAIAALNNESESWQRIMIGKPSPLLERYMKSVNTLYIGQRAIKKAVNDKGVNKGKHGLGVNIIYELPYELYNPMAITGNIKKYEKSNSIVVWLRFASKDGSPIVAPISIDIDGGSGIINNVDTIFDVEYKDYLDDLLREGNILFTENNRSIDELLSQVRMQKSHSSDASMNKLSQDTTVVKPRFQKRDQTETQEFRKWFKGSKIVNDDGAPKIVYHGTSEQFTIFDRTKGRANMDIQGMFFSPREIEASEYGENVGQYYLSIKNPAPESVAYKALSRFKGQNNAGVKAREYLESLGYDGVNNSDEEYIAFHPEQIKSATDNIGTFDPENPDIRFQRRDVLDPIFDELDEEDEARPSASDEELDEAIEANQPAKALDRIVKRRKEALTEWEKAHATKDGRQFKGTEVRKLARTLLETVKAYESASVLEDVKSGIKTETLMNRIAEIAPEVWDAIHGEADQAKATAKVEKLARDILKSFEGKDRSRENELAILNENIPDTVWINSAQLGEIKSAYGTLSEYVKQLKTALGRSVAVRLATDENTANLDADWQAITGTVAQEYTDITDTDEPIALLDIAKSLSVRTERVIPDSDMDEAVGDMTEKILGGVLEMVPVEVNVTAEQAQREVMTELAARAAALKERGDVLEERYKSLDRQYSDAASDSRADRKQLEKQIAELKATIRENEAAENRLEQRIRELERNAVMDVARERKGLRKQLEQTERRAENAKRRAEERLEKEKQAGKEKLTAAREKGTERVHAAREKAAKQIVEAIEDTRAKEQTKAEKRMERLTEEHREAAAKALSKQKKALIREGMARALKARAEGRKEGKAAERERHERRNLEAFLKTGLKKLSDMALHPNTKKHIPRPLMDATSDFMKALQSYTLSPEKSMDTKLLYRLNEAYGRLNVRTDDQIFDVPQDTEVKEALQMLYDATKGKSYGELSVDELYVLKKCLQAVVASIENANKLVGRATKIGIYERAEQLIRELREAPTFPRGIPRKLVFRFLSAERFARLAVGYKQNSVFEQEIKYLNDGAILKEDIAMRANKLYEDFISKYGNEYKKWSGKDAEWIDTGWKGLYDDKPIFITPAMKLSLIMHARNTQNLYHIVNGGIVVPDMDLYKKGDISGAYAKRTVLTLEDDAEEPGSEALTGGSRVIISGSEIQQLEKTLTEAEREYLEITKKLLQEYCPAWINKASMQLYGYNKAEVKDYFPIRTDTHFNKTDFEAVISNASIENMGMLKERLERNKKPIVLEDITSVVKRQIANTALFAGLAVPIRNFNRIYNTSLAFESDSVKLALDQKLGKEDGMTVLENIMRDLQKRPKTEFYDDILNKITSNYVRATLATNLSVTMKQAASYVTAAGEIGWSPVMKALARGGRDGALISRADWELIDRYTPLLYIRRQGMIDRDIADYKANKDWADKLPWLMDWIRKVDVGTVGRLWYAAQYSVDESKPELQKGSDAYYRETARVFECIVQNTQPNYSVMQRPDMLRSQNALWRATTMFKTQSFQNGGLIFDAIGEFAATRKLDANDAHRIEANRKLVNVITSQLASNVILTSMTLAANILTQRMGSWRDKDDEVTAASVGLEVLLSMLSSLAGSFFLGSELFDIAMIAANGISTATGGKEIAKVYEKSSATLDVYNDLQTSLTYLTKAAGYPLDGKPNGWREYVRALDKVAVGASEAFGIPYKNMRNIVDGIVKWGKDFTTLARTGKMDWFGASRPKLDPMNASYNANLAAAYKIWTKTGHNGKTFFYYVNSLKDVTGEDAAKRKRSELMAATDLTPDEKAKLDELLLYGGNAETRIENGVLQKRTAADEWQAISDYNSEILLKRATQSSASDSAWRKVKTFTEAGIKEANADALIDTYARERDAGEGYNPRFREWLLEQTAYTPAQKRLIDETLIGGTKPAPDYTTPFSFYISQQSESVQNAAKELRNAGVDDKTIEAALRHYEEEKKAGKGEKDRFREWLKQQKYTKEVKEQLDMLITGVKKPQFDY